MSDADLRHRWTEKEISQSRKQLIEVDNKFGFRFSNTTIYVTHTAEVGRQTQQVVNHTACQAYPAVGRCRQKIWTQETFDGRLDVPVEEAGQTTRTTLTHQHLDHVVTITAQYAFQCNGLGEMSPPFALNDEQYFHRTSMYIIDVYSTNKDFKSIRTCITQMRNPKENI